MEYIIFTIVAAYVLYMNFRVTRPTEADLQREVDPNGYYQGVTLGKVPLYQMLFNEAIEMMGSKGELTDIDIIGLEEKMKKFHLISDYLITMLKQYQLADEFEREINSDRWVSIVTGLDEKERNKKTAFYPSPYAIILSKNTDPL